MSAFKLFKLLPRFGKLFQFYLEEDRATSRNLRAWNSNLGTTVRFIIFDGINTVNRARARIILVESSMLLKPHCVSSIPVRFHGCRELAPQIRSSLNGIATPVLEKRRQELSLLSRIFLTLAWLRYRPTTHFAKSRFKCGMGQVHFQSSRDVWHCNARFLTFFGCHAPLFPPENLLACSLFLFGPTIELSLGSILFRTLYHPPRVEYILYISGLEITDSNIQYVCIRVWKVKFISLRIFPLDTLCADVNSFTDICILTSAGFIAFLFSPRSLDSKGSKKYLIRNNFPRGFIVSRFLHQCRPPIFTEKKKRERQSPPWVSSLPRSKD